MVVDPNFVPALAAQQLINRNAEEFARNVIQGNVNGGQRAHDGSPTEMGETIEVLPVVLNVQRILVQQIVLHGVNCLGGGFQEAPGAAFSQAGNSGIGFNFAVDGPVGPQNFYIGNFHVRFLLTQSDRVPAHPG